MSLAREHRNALSIKEVLVCTFIFFFWQFAQAVIKRYLLYSFHPYEKHWHLQSARVLWASDTNCYCLASILQM